MTVSRRECLLGVTALLASQAATEAAGRSSWSPAPSVRDGIDAICRKQISMRRAAGMVIHVQRGSAAFARGYGHENLETCSPTTPQTVFRIASLTKQFTAASILLLQQEGKLSLSNPVSRFLPRFPKANAVTIRELLNHTCGIRNLTEGIVPGVDYTLDQMIGIIGHQKPVYEFQPGTRWAYSNTGYALAGAIVEKLTGMAYWDFYRERLFKPLGLSSMAIDRPTDIVPNRASGYAFSKNPIGFENVPYLSWTIPGPAGALRATAGDLARWHRALFHGRVLNAESLKEMTRPARLKNGRLVSTGRAGPAFGPHPLQEYGLGFELTHTDGRARVGHYGAIPGFAADMGTYPTLNLTIVVLTNSDLSSDNPPRGIDGAVLQGTPSLSIG